VFVRTEESDPGVRASLAESRDDCIGSEGKLHVEIAVKVSVVADDEALARSDCKKEEGEKGYRGKQIVRQTYFYYL
jgi:hypothetical protein